MICREIEERIGARERAGIGDDPRLLEHVLGCESCRDLALGARLVQEATALELPAPPVDLERRAILVGEREAARMATPARFGFLDPTVLRWAAGVAAVAGVVLIGAGLVRFDGGRWLPGGGPETVLRGEQSLAPRPLSPRGSVGASAGLRFSWEHALDPAAGSSATTYRLLILDLESGATVLERVIEETSHELSEGELSRLRPGQRYHWLVEPRGADAGEPSEAVAFWLEP